MSAALAANTLGVPVSPQFRHTPRERDATRDQGRIPSSSSPSWERMTTASDNHQGVLLPMARTASMTEWEERKPVSRFGGGHIAVDGLEGEWGMKGRVPVGRPDIGPGVSPADGGVVRLSDAGTLPGEIVLGSSGRAGPQELFEESTRCCARPLPETNQPRVLGWERSDLRVSFLHAVGRKDTGLRYIYLFYSVPKLGHWDGGIRTDSLGLFAFPVLFSTVRKADSCETSSRHVHGSSSCSVAVPSF